MQVQGWDAMFVRAPRRDVHRVVAAVGAYADWWPGVRVEVTGRAAHALRFDLPGLLPSHAVRVRVRKVRADLGVLLDYRGDFEGEAEWYYLDEPAGVVVHYLLRARTAARGGPRRLSAHRAAVRRGLHALKQGFEAGREAGSEPDAWLLAHQRTLIAGSQAGAAGRPTVRDGTRVGAGTQRRRRERR